VLSMMLQELLPASASANYIYMHSGTLVGPFVRWRVNFLATGMVNLRQQHLG